MASLSAAAVASVRHSFAAPDSSSGDEGAEEVGGAVTILFVVASGGFFKVPVNLAVLKGVVADAAGLGGGDGGADFSEVELSHVNSSDALRGWVLRSLYAP